MQRPFTVACRESSTVAEVLDRIGASKYSGNYRRAAVMAERLGVELPVAKKVDWRARVAVPRLDDDQVRARFRRADVPQDNKLLKRWVTSRLRIANACTECSLGPEWTRS